MRPTSTLRSTKKLAPNHESVANKPKYVKMVGYFGHQCKTVFNSTLKDHVIRYKQLKNVHNVKHDANEFDLQGDLLIMNPLTAEPYCGCDPLLLRQYYYPPLKLCYEHLTRGPCEAGLLFAYNHTGDATQCLCNPSILNYNFDTGQCFQFDTKGPCRKGQMYQYSKMTGSGQCLCRKGYVYWPLNGECYKAFTSGPCRPGQFLIPHEQDGKMGQCVMNPCPRAHLYFESSSNFDTEVKCHKV